MRHARLGRLAAALPAALLLLAGVAAVPSPGDVVPSEREGGREWPPQHPPKRGRRPCLAPDECRSSRRARRQQVAAPGLTAGAPSPSPPAADRLSLPIPGFFVPTLGGGLRVGPDALPLSAMAYDASDPLVKCATERLQSPAASGAATCPRRGWPSPWPLVHTAFPLDAAPPAGTCGWVRTRCRGCCSRRRPPPPSSLSATPVRQGMWASVGAGARLTVWARQR
jgi:hypothetical protein